MQLMDIVTAYLYGSLDSDIYMKVPDGIPIPNHNTNHNMCKATEITLRLKTVGKNVV